MQELFDRIAHPFQQLRLALRLHIRRIFCLRGRDLFKKLPPERLIFQPVYRQRQLVEAELLPFSEEACFQLLDAAHEAPVSEAGGPLLQKRKPSRQLSKGPWLQLVDLPQERQQRPFLFVQRPFRIRAVQDLLRSAPQYVPRSSIGRRQSRAVNAGHSLRIRKPDGKRSLFALHFRRRLSGQDIVLPIPQQLSILKAERHIVPLRQAGGITERQMAPVAFAARALQYQIHAVFAAPLYITIIKRIVKQHIVQHAARLLVQSRGCLRE